MFGDYHRERRRLYEKYRRDVEELKIRHGIPEAEREAANRIRAGEVIRRVTRVVRFLRSDFTHHEVVTELVRVEGRAAFPPNRVSIATCLRRLTLGRNPMLVLVRPGVGRRPTVYRLAAITHRPIGAAAEYDDPVELESPF